MQIKKQMKKCSSIIIATYTAVQIQNAVFAYFSHKQLLRSGAGPGAVVKSACPALAFNFQRDKMSILRSKSIVESLHDREVACSASDRISNLVSGGQCHLMHLTILRRLSSPSLAYNYVHNGLEPTFNTHIKLPTVNKGWTTSARSATFGKLLSRRFSYIIPGRASGDSNSSSKAALWALVYFLIGIFYPMHNVTLIKMVVQKNTKKADGVCAAVTGVCVCDVTRLPVITTWTSPGLVLSYIS